MYLGIERFPRIIQGILGWLWIADPFRDEQILHTATSIFPTAGDEVQDSIIELRGWMNHELTDCVIECTRDVYLQRVSHILASRGFCNSCANELSLKSTIDHVGDTHPASITKQVTW